MTIILKLIPLTVLTLILVSYLTVPQLAHSRIPAESLSGPHLVELDAAATLRQASNDASALREPSLSNSSLPSNTFIIPITIALPDGPAAPNTDGSATAIAALDMDISYNQDHVRAIDCTSTDQLDMTACSIKTDGLIQVAAIAATGVVLPTPDEGGLVVAEVTFSVVDSNVLATQITAVPDELVSALGQTIEVTIGPNEIQIPDGTDGTNSENSDEIYLPLVR